MLKKKITYTDFDGNQRTEDFYFNLTKAELIEMHMSVEGGMEKRLERIVETQNSKEIMETIKNIIVSSVGVKSDDGKRFVKSKEISEAFIQSEAYSELIVELLSDAKASSDFMNGIMPAEIRKEMAAHPEMLKRPEIAQLNANA